MVKVVDEQTGDGLVPHFVQNVDVFVRPIQDMLEA